MAGDFSKYHYSSTRSVAKFAKCTSTSWSRKTDRIEQLADQQKERTEMMGRRLNWLAAFFAVPALVLSFLQAAGGVSWGSAGACLLGSMALGWLGLKFILEAHARSR